MKFYKSLSAALVAGSAGLWLIGSGASAQPQPPAPDDVQQNIQDKVQKNAQDAGQTKAKADTKADAQTKSKIQADDQANVKSKARAGARGRTDTDKRGANADADADAKVRQRGEAGNQANVKSKAQAGARGRTDADQRGANADADAQVRQRGDAEARLDDSVRAGATAQGETDLGFQFDQNQPDTLTVRSVSEEGLGARAGLRAGDRIISVDGRRFDTAADVNAFLRRQEGRRIPITYMRDGRRYSSALVWNDDARIRQTDRMRGDIADGRRGHLFGTSFREDARGVVVNDVYDGSPAQQAGLQAGDQIVCFNGWSYRDADQFTQWVNRFPRGRALPVTYRRDGRLYSTRVTLSDANSNSVARAPRTYLDDSGRRVPPAPGAEEIAQGNNQGRRRTAMRPNFDEMTREQLQQELQELRRENNRLRRDLNELRGNLSPQAPDVDVDAESNGETEIESETEIDDGTRIESETELERNDSATEIETDSEIRN